MTYTPIIYDWRLGVQPINQVFYGGGLSDSGGLTLAGAQVSIPAPGGRATMRFEFASLAITADNIDASWTISALRSDRVFRVPLYESVQLVPAADIGLTSGVLWSLGQSWANGLGWASNPAAEVQNSWPAGGVTFTARMGPFGAPGTQVLKIGHVIGFTSGAYDFAHVVMDISYSGGIATVTIDPPLRRALVDGNLMRFRPRMMATCRNAGEVITTFRSGRNIGLGAALFVEALV